VAAAQAHEIRVGPPIPADDDLALPQAATAAGTAPAGDPEVRVDGRDDHVGFDTDELDAHARDAYRGVDADALVENAIQDLDDVDGMVGQGRDPQSARP